MTSDANIIIGIKGDVSGGATIKRSLNDIEKSSGSAKTAVDQLTKKVMELAAAYLSVREVIHQFNSAIGAGVELQALNNKMAAATGNAKIAAESFDFLRDMSEKLGLNFKTSAEGFAGFSAAALRAGITFGDVKTIFQDVATAATSMRLPAEQVQGIFTALEQMASKGTVQMQELKLQLGNNLPGAFEIFAKSMGVTTSKFNEMISNGEVGVDKLKGFAEELKNELGGSASTASRQLTSEIARLQNATFNLRTEFSNAGALEGYTVLVRTLTELFKDQGFQDGVKNIGKYTGEFFTGISNGIGQLQDFVGWLEKYRNIAGSMTGIGDQFSNANFGGKKYGTTENSVIAHSQLKSQALLKKGGDFYSMMGITSPADNAYTLGNSNQGPTKEQEKAAEKAAKAIEKVTKNIQFETAQLSRNKEEQEIYNNLKLASVTIDSAAGQNIAELTRKYYENKTAMEAQKKIIDGVTHATEGFFKAWMTGADGFRGAVKGMIAQLADLAFQIEVIDPIKKNLLGGSSGGGGIISALFSAAGSIFTGGSSGLPPVPGHKPPVPGFATGGSMVLGGAGGVDQNQLSLNGVPIANTGRGEVLSISPNQKGGGGTPIVVNQSINLSLGVQEAVAAQLSVMMPQIQRATQAAVESAQMRGIRAL